MRISHFLFFIFFATLFSACKKDVLHWRNIQKLNSNTTCRLNHVRFINDTICIAAGGVQFTQSQIIRSADGGYTWSAYSSSDAPKEMFGMGVASNGNIYLCGIDGDVLHSKDLGKTWQFNRINWEQYVGASFPTPDTGIFVSTVLQRQCSITRVDSNFNIIDEKTFLFGINNIYMPTSSTGYVIGYGTVMKTTDCGNIWDFQDVKGDNFMAMDIHGDEIWMCGYNGSVFHTINGGANWDRLRNGNDISLPRYNMLDIVFKDEQNGWAVCDNAKVIHTDDGGNHWAEYDQLTTDGLRSIAICPNGDLLVAGDNGALYRIIPK
ncbi:MAG: WD40/YVTN/BNR-like repeat-containing protein [Chitinophagales bacterium]